MDKKLLHDKLTDAFIDYQYNLDHPFGEPLNRYTKSITERAIHYRSDKIFRTKVDRLVSGVMSIINVVENKEG